MAHQKNQIRIRQKPSGNQIFGVLKWFRNSQYKNIFNSSVSKKIKKEVFQRLKEIRVLKDSEEIFES